MGMFAVTRTPNGGRKNACVGSMRLDAGLTGYNPERMRFLQIVADLSKESPHGWADGEEVRRRMGLSETELRALVMQYMQSGDLDNTAPAGSIKLSRSAMAARS